MNYNIRIITRPEFLFSFFIKAFSKFFPIPTNTKNRKNLCSNGSEKTVTKLQNLILFYRISRKKQALFSSEAWGTFCLCVHFVYQNYEMARFYITILQHPKTRSRQMSFP